MIYLVIFIVGLFAGKIATLLSEKSLNATWGENCPACGAKYPWYFHIPMIGFLLITGKCKTCKLIISPEYPLIELLLAFIWSYLYYRIGFSAEFLLYSLFSIILTVITITDLADYTVEDNHIKLGLLLALPFQIYMDKMPTALTGAVVGLLISGVFWLLINAYAQLRHLPESFGLGDITCSILFGFILGWENFLAVFFTATFIQGLLGLYMNLKEKLYSSYSEKYLPLVPTLTLTLLINSQLQYGLLGFFDTIMMMFIS